MDTIQGLFHDLSMFDNWMLPLHIFWEKRIFGWAYILFMYFLTKRCVKAQMKILGEGVSSGLGDWRKLWRRSKLAENVGFSFENIEHTLKDTEKQKKNFLGLKREFNGMLIVCHEHFWKRHNADIFLKSNLVLILKVIDWLKNIRMCSMTFSMVYRW